MFAITKTCWVALGFSLVACAGSSTPNIPPPTGDQGKPIPSFGDQAPTPAASDPEPQADTKTADNKKTDDTNTDDNKPPECPTEKEPNNDPSDATPFTSCIKGELTGWTDTDNLSIVVPQGAAQMVIDHIDPDGTIQYNVTSGGGAGGNSNMSFTADAPKTAVKPGTKYNFALKWDNNGSGAVTDKRSYAIRVAFLH
jgi:hypothetical protein